MCPGAPLQIGQNRWGFPIKKKRGPAQPVPPQNWGMGDGENEKWGIAPRSFSSVSEDLDTDDEARRGARPRARRAAFLWPANSYERIDDANDVLMEPDAAEEGVPAAGRG